MVDLLQEIKDDIKQERTARLWSKYGPYLLLLALAIVIGTAGKVWWNHSQVTEQQALGGEYYRTLRLVEAGQWDEARKELERISQSDTPGYSAVANLTLAGKLMSENDLDGAYQQYKTCLANHAVDPVLQGLCRVFMVYLAIENNIGDEKSLAEQLTALTRKNSPWYYTGLQLEAAHAMKKGQWQEAYDIFSSLHEDANTPGGMKMQAAELMEAIKNQHADKLGEKEKKDGGNA